MADDLAFRGPADQLRVGLDQPREAEWWARKFDVTVEELMEAIEAVGNVAANVEEYFATKKSVAPPR